MINNDNNQKDEDKEVKQVDMPDEQPGIAVQGFLKIFDPDSGEVILQGRA